MRNERKKIWVKTHKTLEKLHQLMLSVVKLAYKANKSGQRREQSMPNWFRYILLLGVWQKVRCHYCSFVISKHDYVDDDVDDEEKLWNWAQNELIIIFVDKKLMEIPCRILFFSLSSFATKFSECDFFPFAPSLCVCLCVYHGDSIEKLDTMDFPHSYYFQFDVTITRAPNRILYVAAGNMSFFSLSHFVIGHCAGQRRRRKTGGYWSFQPNLDVSLLPAGIRFLFLFAFAPKKAINVGSIVYFFLWYVSVIWSQSENKSNSDNHCNCRDFFLVSERVSETNNQIEMPSFET